MNPIGKAALIASGLVFASTALAGCPLSWPRNSSCSASCIRLVSNDARGVAAPNSAFTVPARGLGYNPVANVPVFLDFTNHSVPSSIRVQGGGQPPGPAQECARHLVSLTTDALGSLTFIVVGGAQNLGDSPGMTAARARVFVDCWLVGAIGVAAFDQNGSGGLTSADIGALVGDLFGGFKSRSDPDCSGDPTSATSAHWSRNSVAPTDASLGRVLRPQAARPSYWFDPIRRPPWCTVVAASQLAGRAELLWRSDLCRHRPRIALSLGPASRSAPSRPA